MKNFAFALVELLSMQSVFAQDGMLSAAMGNFTKAATSD